MEAVIQAEGLEKVETYILHFHNTIAQYISTRPIIELCLAVDWRPGTRIVRSWWEQECINLEGVRVSARATEVLLEEGLEEDLEEELELEAGAIK